MNKVRIELSKPIRFMDEEISVLELREPILEDLLKLDEVEGQVHKDRQLVSVLSGISPGSLNEISGQDWIKKIQPVLIDFLSGGQKIGENA